MDKMQIIYLILLFIILVPFSIIMIVALVYDTRKIYDENRKYKGMYNQVKSELKQARDKNAKLEKQNHNLRLFCDSLLFELESLEFILNLKEK